MAGNDSPELIESKGIELVRPDERTGTLRDQTTLWFSANVQFAALTAGALSTAIFGLDFLWAAVAIVLGLSLFVIFGDPAGGNAKPMGTES